MARCINGPGSTRSALASGAPAELIQSRSHRDEGGVSRPLRLVFSGGGSLTVTRVESW
jgi:hypothetical protein